MKKIVKDRYIDPIFSLTWCKIYRHLYRRRGLVFKNRKWISIYTRAL